MKNIIAAQKAAIDQVTCLTILLIILYGLYYFVGKNLKDKIWLASKFYLI